MKLGQVPITVLSKITGQGSRLKLYIEIQQNLDQILGRELIRSVNILAVDETTLTFCTEDPVMAHEIELNSRQILGNLTRLKLIGRISRIRCRVRGLRPDEKESESFTLSTYASEIQDSVEPEPKSLDPERLPLRAQIALKKVLAKVEDQALRSMLQRVLVGSSLRFPAAEESDERSDDEFDPS